MTRRRLVSIGVVLAAGLFDACGPAVSDHDNRIFGMAASVKLSAADLSQAYGSDAGDANGRYRGRVLEISGVVRGVRPEASQVVMGGSETGPMVEASLHEDVSAQILATVADGQRLTLKCFCEGLNDLVRLKSCVPPDPVR